MKKIFNVNQSAKVNKNAFDLSHERKLSCKMGQLVPVLLQEVVPGDTFHIDTESMIRFAPLVAPTMHRINSFIHYFFVPNRILLPKNNPLKVDWEDFITSGNSVLPIERATEITEGSLGDHLGFPVFKNSLGAAIDANVLPLLAYRLVYQEYYRDENLEPNFNYITGGSYNNSLFLRAWEKDYFTSALPWAQKGNPVTMQAEIVYKAAEIYPSPDTNAPYTAGDPLQAGAVITDTNKNNLQSQDDGNTMFLENIEGVEVSVEELRRATRLQRWLERNARSGSRYVEHLLAHWGVMSSDARLQRPEYIGGGRSPVVISEVLNTTGTDDLPQGNMAGHAINVGRTNHASKYCEEHGLIIGIMSVMPEPTYQQGVPKLFTRRSNLDFYFPEFAQLGEQPVLNQEIFLSPSNEDFTQDVNFDTFGYQSRYAEYKQQFSTVHGAFKSGLDFWHLGRIFEGLPALSNEFIKCNPAELARIFAVFDPDVENLYVQLYHRIKAIRPMPFFNDPKL